jgi:DNA-binding transcriptional ArsR family regulator
MIYQRGFLARPLDSVLGNASRLAALRVLVAHPEGVSGRQVAVRAGVNHQAAALALKALEKAGLVLRRDYGRSILWRLDRKSFLVDETLLGLFKGEGRHAEEIVTAIKDRLNRKADAVIIVGAAAKGRLAAGAPLELVVLCEPGRRRALPEASRELARELRERFAVTLKVETLARREIPARLEIHDGWQLLPTEGRPSFATAGR